jgi:predicted membrane-bound mannosyltransferase
MDSFVASRHLLKQALIIVCWIGVMAAGVFLRFDGLADRPFHADEATGAKITAQRLESGGVRFDPRHFHGPLLGGLAAPLCRLRGENSWQDMSKHTLRLLPAAAGALLVMVPLLGRRRYGDPPMLLAAALLATSPLLAYYSRMFIHEMLLALAGMAALFFLTGGWRGIGRDRSPQRSGEWGGNDPAHATIEKPSMGDHSLPIRKDRPECLGRLQRQETPAKRILHGRRQFGPCLRLVTAAFLLGLMYAIKETVVISVLAWSGAGLCLLVENRARIDRGVLMLAWRRLRAPLAAALAVFILSAGFFYTDAFRNPRGAIDALRTFFVYENVGGHDKSPIYYLQLLMLPHKSAGLWWFGTPVVLLALCALAMTFIKHGMAAHQRVFIRFLAWSVLFHLLIYSVISYKNPWLACLPWAHVCLLAGFAFTGISGRGAAARVMLVGFAGVCVVTQFRQTRAATGRLASDARNPFAYVPTRRDVESIEAWLTRLRGMTPAGTLEPVAVIGGEYWPLPWYLRAFDKTGYWREPPPDLAALPLVFSMPDTAEAVSKMLADTHVALPRGLRPEVPVMLYLRNDIWELWMSDDPR